MIAILSLAIVLVVSLVIVRVATVALTLTGVSSEMARFQARSAFTGAGFTTTESEKVVGHPVRRRIIMLLMLLGNAGIVTAVSSLILSFTGSDESAGITGSLWFRLTLLAVCLGLLLVISHSQWIDNRMSTAIRRALQKWTNLEVRDYASLLRLTGDYTVSELQVGDGDWTAGRSLGELSLNKEGVLVLGIERSDGTFVGAPRGSTRLDVHDTLLLYGRGETLAELDTRPSGATGNRAHVRSIGEQLDVRRNEAGEQAASASSHASRRPTSAGDESGAPERAPDDDTA